MYLKSLKLTYTNSETKTSKTGRNYDITYFSEEGTGLPVSVYFSKEVKLEPGQSYIVLYDFNPYRKQNQLRAINVEKTK